MWHMYANVVGIFVFDVFMVLICEVNVVVGCVWHIYAPVSHVSVQRE